MSGSASGRGARAPVVALGLMAAMLMAVVIPGSAAADHGGRFGGKRSFVRGGPTFTGASYRYKGGHYGRHGGGRLAVGPRFYGGSRYSCGSPRVSFSVGLGWGYPRYYRPYPAYGYCPSPYPAYVAYRDVYTPHRRPFATREPIDVANEPPAGCHYYDPYCERRFETLDDYTDHLSSVDHERTIDVVDDDSGDRLHTYVYARGYWSAQD